MPYTRTRAWHLFGDQAGPWTSLGPSCEGEFLLADCSDDTDWLHWLARLERQTCDCRVDTERLAAAFGHWSDAFWGAFELPTLLALLGCCLVVGWAIWGALEKHHFSSWCVAALRVTSQQPSRDPAVVRSTFMAMPNGRAVKAKNHTHPMSAASRSRGSVESGMFARLLGEQPYYVQKSASDDRCGRTGSRWMFWGKDLTSSYAAQDPVGVAAMIDVDYYIDMPTWLSRHVLPTVLYTFCPSRVSNGEGEYSYTFDKHNTVHYRVSGGGKYEHELWDYGADVMIAVRHVLWFWKVAVVYNIDRRRIDADHQLVLLTPIARSSFPFLGLDNFLSGHKLCRLAVCQKANDGEDDFLRLQVQGADGLLVSTGRAMSHQCATISATLDDAIATLSRLGKTPLTVAQVKTACKDDDLVGATMLVDYHRSTAPCGAPTVYPVASSSFQFNPQSYDPDAKLMMVPYMSPLILGNTAPTKNKSNEEQAVAGRVTNVRPAQLEVDGIMLRDMDEFLRELMPEPSAHFPCDAETVYDKQNRPTQRRILDEADAVGGIEERTLSTFMKAEAYGKVTDPRIITIIPGQNKAKYSQYTYAFAELMREQEWYAFGKTPLEIALRVAEVCETADMVVLTDLSRCDGRISNVSRLLERLALLRYFHTSCHDDLCEVLATQSHQKARTTEGVKYETGEARLSGSPETADMNTLTNVFMAYRAHRGVGKTHREAMRQLGIYGGDDGLTPNIDPVSYTATVAQFGQVLEAEVVLRHSRGVNFLARYYSPDVWSGAADSMCDVKRQLGKLHLTPHMPGNVRPIDKLVEKCRGYAATDPNTPLIGAVAWEVLACVEADVLVRAKTLDLRGVAAYGATAPPGDQYPNEYGSWMDDEIELAMPNFAHELFAKWLLDSTMHDEFLSPPLCLEAEVKVDTKEAVVVDGDVHNFNKQPCEHYAAGKCTFGDKCRFAHVGAIPQATPVCGQFKKTGTCKFGEKCKYSHAPAPPAGT